MSFPIGTRVKHRERQCFAKILDYFLGSRGLVKVSLEDRDRVFETWRETDLEEPTDQENQAKLFQEMVKMFLQAAEKRWVKEWKSGRIPRFGAGNPFTLDYTAPFDADVIEAMAKKIGFELPKVLLVAGTDF